MKLHPAVIPFLLISTLSAQAEDVPVPAPSANPPVRWRGYLGVGSTFGPKTDLTVKYRAQSLAGSSTSGKGSVNGALELEAIYHPIFSTSLAVDFGSYKYEDGSPSDSSLSILIIPKARTKFGLWAGLGFGMNRTGIGETSARSGSTTLTYDDGTVSAFTWSPRIGYDTEVSPGLTIGGYAAYYTGSADTTVSVVNIPQGVNDKLTLDFTRKWWDVVVRVGFDL